MEFEVGKVYACSVYNLYINEYYEDDNKVELRYESTSLGSGITLLKCISVDNKLLFEEYYTSHKVVSSASFNSKRYVLTNDSLFEVKKQILNRELLYIDKDSILEINDDILERLSRDINTSDTVKYDVNKKVARSRMNLYEAYNKIYQNLINYNYRLALAENMIRDFESKNKVLKKDYTC